VKSAANAISTKCLVVKAAAIRKRIESIQWFIGVPLNGR